MYPVILSPLYIWGGGGKYFWEGIYWLTQRGDYLQHSVNEKAGWSEPTVFHGLSSQNRLILPCHVNLIVQGRIILKNGQIPD